MIIYSLFFSYIETHSNHHNPTNMKNYLLLFIASYLLGISGNQLLAQFSDDTTQTFFVCNATGNQLNLRAFSDGSNGTYSFWLDKRNGSAGTAIYGQHLDSLGNPDWSVNGKQLCSAVGKEIWTMDAVTWQNGFLVAWIQGGFGVGGDTLFANYFDLNGDPMWPEPVVVGNKQGLIIYVSIDNLNIFPTTNGANIIYGLVLTGGSNFLSWNNIDYSGNLRWALDSNQYFGNGYYYVMADDGYDGFYVAASTGGLGASINVGHFDENGLSTISSPVNISTVAGGRNGVWNVFCDSDTNAYVAWESNPTGNVFIAKIEPDGTLPWSVSGEKPVCTAAGFKANTYAKMYDDTIYVQWDDPRNGATNYRVYMQKLNTDGNPLWTVDGIQVTEQSGYLPYGKFIKAGDQIISTYNISSVFRAQSISPDSSLLWGQNGLTLNSANPCNSMDQVTVESQDGSTTVFWSEPLGNICASRIRENGTLTEIVSVKKSTMNVYPNPAKDQIHVNLSGKVSGISKISIFSSMGKLMLHENFRTDSKSDFVVNTSALISGTYFIRVEGDDYNYNSRFVIMN